MLDWRINERSAGKSWAARGTNNSNRDKTHTHKNHPFIKAHPSPIYLVRANNNNTQVVHSQCLLCARSVRCILNKRNAKYIHSRKVSRHKVVYDILFETFAFVCLLRYGRGRDMHNSASSATYPQAVKVNMIWHFIYYSSLLFLSGSCYSTDAPCRYST